MNEHETIEHSLPDISNETKEPISSNHEEAENVLLPAEEPEILLETPNEEEELDEKNLPLPSTEELQNELTSLRQELEQTKALHARMACEIGEFHALFPDVNTQSLPESVWEQVKNGIPLAASYALYEKKCEMQRRHADQINLQNAQRTPGSAGKHTPAEYFSPDEVRQMSQSEVSSNYQKILDSMKKWNI